MKKVLSFILVLSMVLGSFGMAFAAPATDIAGHANEDAILRLNKLGIVTGDDRGFAPNANITRAEFAVLLVRALGLEASSNLAKGDTQFTDVTVAAGYEWASGAINVASRLGYINGYGDGKFGPADNIRYEDAITLVVRALGYEPAAQDKGGYPVGYLVVAEQDLDITDKTNGVAGVAATRGIVFQMLDNALTEPMMIQVGYGTDKKYVVSGTEDTKVKYLFDQLGLDKYAGRVLDFDQEDLEITVTYTVDEVEKTKVLNVEEGFDFQEAFATKLTIWADGKDVVTYGLNETVVYDAVTVTETEEEIKLVDANKKYEITEKTLVFIDGEEKEATDLVEDDAYNYAKVVLDGKKVVLVAAYDLEEVIVVNSVKDDVVFQGDKEELDLEDYTIVKAGKTISVEDLVEGDILFYNDDIELAEVFNNSKTGTIERIYTEEVKLEGKVYNFLDAKYNDAGTFAALTADVLEEMEEEDKDVEFFLNRAGQLVLVVGVRAEVKTNSFYGYVAEDTKQFDTRGKSNYTLDVLNQEGKIAKYDVSTTSSVYKKYEETNTWATDMKKGVVVKVTVDEDGDLTKVEKVTAVNINNVDVKQKDTYALDSYRLQGSAIVFWTEGETAVKDYTVMTWEAAAEEFDIVKSGTLYVSASDRVVAIVADTTDADVESDTVRGLVTKVRTLKAGDTEITVEVNGTKESYVIKDGTVTDTVYADDFAAVKVRNEKVTGVTKLTGTEIEVESINRSNNTIKATNGKTYELVADGVVYDDEFEIVRLRDLVKGDTVTVYSVTAGSRFVDYVVVK